MKTSLLAFASVSVLLLACSGSSSNDVLGPSSSSSGGSSSGGTSTTDPTTPSDNPDPADPDPNPNPKPQPKPNDPVTSSGPPATPADCDAFAAKFCPKADACNHLVSKIVGAACEERVAGICKARLSAPGTGFNQTTLAACGNAYTTMTCAKAFGEVQPAACNFKGTLALNSPCAFDDQCASGSCGGNDENTCGKCSPSTSTPPSTPKAGLGEACDNSGQSAPQCNYAFGLWCDSATKKCADIPTVAVGKACGFVGESLVMCNTGAVCSNYGSGGTGTCVAEKGIGAACSAADGDECTFGTACIGGKCAYPTAAAICK